MTSISVYPNVVLASGSPRRTELLARLVSSFTVLTSPVEEQGDDRFPDWNLDPVSLPEPFAVEPAHDPRLWAWRKATDVVQQHAHSIAQGSIVLGADTVVVAPGKLLNKPTSLADARDMLNLLRGRDHYVVTGFVLLKDDAGLTVLHSEAVTAQVVMRAFSEEEVEVYLSTGESMDKAGAYALQGLGEKLVERVEGCRTTVIGLPVCRVRDALQAAGADLLPFPVGGYCSSCASIKPGS